jgi:radical SAM superfamily enzyme YgiQ (UPF0313 family)
MKVLLLSPPYLPEYMRNGRCDFVSLSHTQWYPIWLGYCGALLEKHNHIVKIIDAPAYGLTHKETLREILDFSPEWLVVYSSTASEDNDIKFIEEVSSTCNCKAVFVGPYVSIHPEDILKKSKKINFAVKGEFEYPVLELIEGLECTAIKNLVFKEDNYIHSNEKRPLLSTKELDEIPFVTDFFWRHLNLRYYKAPSEPYPFLDLMTGRGCQWGLCTFCLWVHSFIPGSVYNKRSISNVIDELSFVTRKIPEVKSVMLQDDTLSPERAVELSEAILKAPLKLTWSCYVRAEINLKALKLMKKAGCINLHVGYESASPIVLRNIKKGLSFEKMIEFTQNAKKAGLRIHADFVIGFNGETVESIKETIKWAKKLNPDTAQFQLVRAYPTTPLYECLKSNNYLKDGEPNYPELTNEQIRKWAKRAYREFYLSLRYAKRVILNPKQYFFNQLRTISRAIPAMFWKRW